MKLPKPDTDTRGKVTVNERGYRPKGEFSYIYANDPIFREETGKLCGVTNPRDMTYIHTYGGEYVFFDGIAKGKLIASKCENPDCEETGSIHMPFRIHCPDCLVKAIPADITNTARESARIYSFMVTERTGAFNVLDKPIKFINIEFDGVNTILMSVMLNGEPEIGMRVVPIFRTKAPTYTILDLAFVPEGTREEDLPEDFTFGS